MLNPILKNRNYTIGYLITWVVITSILFFVVFYFYHFGLIIALSESIAFSGLYALIGVGIWYPVYYTDLETNKLGNFLTNHLASSSLAVGIWLWINYVIMSALFSGNHQYINFLNNSIPLRIGVGFLLYLIITSNYYLIIYYQNFKDKVFRESELKALVKESELKSLKSQINPHFLFNSLNSISSLTMISPERAQDMVINLSDFLRYSLSHKQDGFTSLEKEMQNIDRYLKIEKIRFGKRLHVEKEINEACKRCRLPGLILQPIIENAIKYGIYESTEQSNILISCRFFDDIMEVVVKNDYDPDFIKKRGTGIGLKNVMSRLKVQYGRDDLVKINRTSDTFEIILRFPQ